MEPELRKRLEARRAEAQRESLRNAFAKAVYQECSGLQLRFFDLEITQNSKFKTRERLKLCEARRVDEPPAFCVQLQLRHLIEQTDTVLLFHPNDDLIGAVMLQFDEFIDHAACLHRIDLGNQQTTLVPRDWMLCTLKETICAEILRDEVQGLLARVWPCDVAT